MTAITPGTAPVELALIPRQGRHTAHDPFDPDARHEETLSRLLSQVPGRAPLYDRPLALKQRIARDSSNLERLRRALPQLRDPRRRAETSHAIRTLTADIAAHERALDRLVDEGRTRRWGPADFEPGDRVRYMAAWYDVVGVGPEGLTVVFRRGLNGVSWDVPAEYSRVTGRDRNGVEDLDAA
ncbi:hypothetical protein KIH74_10960 [Kineosporia sp. J2-2]|uniref:Uncharacterized protein n=1 Tax=Kineosporia corallincola TaxID=2835133 RepID=A0ABS5TEE6_9ACTN|nr:hypothetical protein [Kineosporia corallincola]MBT0769442.1 hypothetical protein [Kineosporia corallincola]